MPILGWGKQVSCHSINNKLCTLHTQKLSDHNWERGGGGGGTGEL